MNMKNKIEQCLRAAPKPTAPDGLLGKLQNNIAFREIKTKRSNLRRWFSPKGGSVSGWRVAAFAAIAIAVIMPLSYGATKAVKYVITTFEAEFEYGDNMVYKVKTSVASSSDNIQSKEAALKAQQEFYELYKEGKAEEIKSGVWVATLSDGEKFAFAGNPESLGLIENERTELLQEQFDEINELRKAGEYERTFIKEIEEDGVTIRLYKDTFKLSGGKVVTLTSGAEK